MKKLLLTAVIFGLMTGVGAFADPRICPPVDEIIDAQKEHPNVFRFVFEYLDGYYQVSQMNHTAPKKLVSFKTKLLNTDGFYILCTYDNDLEARLSYSKCHDDYRPAK